MPTRIKARDIMKKKLITLAERDDVFSAIDKLLDNQISGAPVLDKSGDFVGLFSEKSCMTVLVTGTYHRLPGTHVGAFMSTSPETITPSTDLLAIGRIFQSSPLRRLPVLEDGKLVGQVSRRDVLRAMKQLHADERPSRPPAALYLSAVSTREEAPFI